MYKEIKELLSLVRKERILITKMVEADEREDSYLFNELQKSFKKTSFILDNFINKKIDDGKYDEIIELLSNKIDELVEKQENAEDYVTLLGLFNSCYLNKTSNSIYNSNSDAFSNEFVLQIYDIYLWMMNNNNYTKEFNDSLRTDLVMKLVNSRAMRKYFSGEYEEASIMSNPLNDEDFSDRNKLGTVYSSLMLAQIELSNKFEAYEGIFDDLSFESRKKLLEVEFASVSSILMKRGFLIPPNVIDYSDFTEEVLRNASILLDEYNNRKTKEKNKILLK